MSHIRSFRALLIIIAMLFVQACAPAPQASTQAQPAASAPAQTEQTTVKVATLPFISFAPFHIGKEEGYFAEQGLNVELVEMKVQQEIVPALASGQVDVASGLMSAGILNTIAKGGKIQIVADKGFIDPEGCDNHALVARRGLIESGVRENPEQLRGATFAVVRATWVDYYAEKALNQAGLKVEDMQLTDIPSASQPEALDQGQIDLVSQNEPWVTRLKQGGHEPILTPAHELLPSANSAVTLYGPTLLNGDPDVGNRFMVAYLKAVRQYNEGKTDRNVEILAKYIQLDPALIREMCWPGLRDDGQLNVQSALDFQQWALDKKFMETAVSEEQFWNGSFVDYANAQLGAAQQ